MEILKNFGFNPVILVAQIVNFLIILYLLKRFMYKPVLEMLKKRQKSIEDGIKQAEEAKQTLENALSEEKKILEKAKIEASNIVEEAKTNSLQISSQIEESAKKQAESILIEAKKQIKLEGNELEKRLIVKVSILAEDIVKKSLKGIFTPKEQKEITKRALKQMKKVN